jgi:hypothetical protein
MNRRDAIAAGFGGIIGATLMAARPKLYARAVTPAPLQSTPQAGAQGSASPGPTINLADWVDTTGARDATAGIRGALNSLSKGGIVTGPLGAIYACSDEIVIPHHGITFDFAGSHPAPSPWPTLFDFSALPTGRSCFSANGKKGLGFKNFNLQATNGRGGAGIKVFNAAKVDVDGVVMTMRRGPGAFGLQLGDLSSGENAVIASGVRNCVIAAEGVPFLVGAGCTAVGLLHNYAIAPSGDAGYYFFRSTYCGAEYCACDSGTGSAYGYKCNGAVAISLRACGAESNAKGFAMITGGSHAISLEACRGVNNNTSADRAIGSFAEIAGGSNYNLKIDTCEDTTPHAGTSVNIRAAAGTGKTTIVGYNTTSFPNGYTAGSDPAWIASHLSIV